MVDRCSMRVDVPEYAMDTVQRKYRFLRKLGGNRLSTVFLAQRRDNGRSVVFKVITPAGTSAERTKRAARFRHEVYVNSLLDHPGIAPMIDSGKIGQDLLFLVVDYVEGEPLSSLLAREGALTVARTAALMQDVAANLDVIHGCGVVHGDIKPDNILIVGSEQQPVTRIIDFGLSSMVSPAVSPCSRTCLNREFSGTVLYAAPEQIMGKPVTVQTDLYSWGLVTLECLNGRDIETRETVHTVIRERLGASPVSLPAAIRDHPLEEIILGVLEPDAALRTINARSLVEQLDLLTNKQSESSREKKQRTAMCNDTVIFFGNAVSRRRPPSRKGSL